MSFHAKLIVRHSYLIIITVSVVSTVLTIIPLVCHDFPSFTDPIVGFETRGTTLAHRFIAWENLIDETRPSRRLAVNPKDIEDQIRMSVANNKTQKSKSKHSKGNRSKIKIHLNRINKPKKSLNKTRGDSIRNGFPTPPHVHFAYGKNISYDSEENNNKKGFIRKQWASLKNMSTSPVKPNFSVGCGSPLADYAHLVVSSTDGTSLLKYENVLSICELQSKLFDIGSNIYCKLCQKPFNMNDDNSNSECCPAWSIPNYIAVLSNKTSCFNLTREDVQRVVYILLECASYFHSFQLLPDCEIEYCAVPTICSEHNAIYNLLFYLIDVNAFPPSNNNQTHVQNAMIFLPLPCSSTTLPYYLKLQSFNMSHKALKITAMDMGVKNALFDLWIIEDTWLVGLGGFFVFLCIWIYAGSFIMTCLIFLAITFSLGISYFIYTYIFLLDFFPFMNLLVIVVVIGIGADDAFLYLKVWRIVRDQRLNAHEGGQENSSINISSISSETVLIEIVDETLHHSLLTMLVTTITTAVAFFASYVSYIPAINCFSVFAGTAVLVNFFIMIVWLPSTVLILTRFRFKKIRKLELKIIPLQQAWRESTAFIQHFIVYSVTKLHLVFFLVLGGVGLYSIVVVFSIPGLQFPDSKQFQLFSKLHPFEQYDTKYKDLFMFERFNKNWGVGAKMPLRWIWGVNAVDNGNHMNPISTGYLELDDKFSISDPNSQLWLNNFCAKLKYQSFYQPTLGPLLPNCFIESFNLFMGRKCIDDIDEIDRTPCCESSIFPYSKKVFDLCIIQAVESLYQTPSQFFIPGVAGPKFLRNSSPPRVVSLVVEFESVVPSSMSYSSMNEFYMLIENWTQHELKTAPDAMKNGWFLSDLQFYDLQGTLASGTVIALILSSALGLVVLLPSTMNFVVSLCAAVAMAFSVTVTISVLVLSGWKLNVLESIAISTSAGLAVDFNLHYALSYSNASGSKGNRVVSALSSSIGPTAAAALTTGFAGIFLLHSNVLPYSQIGTFLALIMTVSWVYSTFFLCSLLFIFGQKASKDPPTEEVKTASRVSSICSGVPNLESHELEHLHAEVDTRIQQSNSPSSHSATTVVLHTDDYDNIGKKNYSVTDEDSDRENVQLK